MTGDVPQRLDPDPAVGESARGGLAPGIFTVAPGAPFLDALAGGLLARFGDDPLSLSEAVVLLPTRRACRALAESFLRLGGGKPSLLPRMRPIGDVDADELVLTGLASEADAVLPPAIAPLRRRLLLAEMILAAPRLAGERGREGAPPSPEAALHLAGELARLIDQVQAEEVGFAGFAGLAPADYAAHWQVTLEFLAIATRHWPAVLEAEGCLDPVDRRNRLLRAQAEAWRRAPPPYPVIAAGSTGSLPATAALLAVVAGLPRGAVVLPGLDRDLAPDAWAAIDATHPQAGLKHLLTVLAVERTAVPDWAPADTVPPSDAAPPAEAAARAARMRLLAEALRPAEATAAWRMLPPIPPAALSGLSRYDCAGSREEAALIALLLRETLQRAPDRTAALVTPDRGLARRVAAELRRWAVEVDDSAGTPLHGTPPGTFLAATAAMAASRLAPLPLLAALKHPLAGGGQATVRFRSRVRQLERFALRGPRPEPGFAGLRDALRRPADRWSGETRAETAARRALEGWLDWLEAQAGPLLALVERGQARLPELLDAHLAFAEALAATADEPGALRLWAGDAGAAAAEMLAELREAASRFPPFRTTDYPAVLAALLAEETVRPSWGRHPRLTILGPLEARLLHADRVVLGGMNEANWPPVVETGPWLSRPMRAALGLSPPERRIGQSAHDFAQIAAAPEAVLTRAAKVDGAPTVPSRWLLRLDTVLSGAGQRPLANRQPPLPYAWVAALDAPPARPPPPGRPAPRPPVATRPRRLSVTEIETWVRDPYALYARRILELRALDPLDAEPGAAERGTMIHDALDLFYRSLEMPGGPLPPDAPARLRAAGEAAFRTALALPAVRAFWWPRFLRIAEWVVTTEAARQPAPAARHSEVRGRLALSAPGGAFVLTATADRVDRMPDGTLEILDYKTGTVPSGREVDAGYAPQLPLEAAIALAGGFADVPAARVAALAYWHLSGRRDGGQVKPVKADPDPVARAGVIHERLLRRIAAYDREETPYTARPLPAFAPRFSDYEHLERVREWIGADDGEEGP